MKHLVIILLAFSLTRTASAQEVGIRFGDVVGNAVAVDAVFGTSEFSRIHANLSFGDGVGIEALWDFLYRPLGGEAFDWYVGAGASMDIDDPFRLGVSGEIGLEYHFNTVPIALGLDWRPTFWIVEETDFGSDGFGLNVRYCFGK